jgi:hypothetical protein
MTQFIPGDKMTITVPLNFQLGPGFWACIPPQSRRLLCQQYAGRAKDLLSRNQESLPDDGRLQLIVEAAMEARQLCFVAALREPSTEELDCRFDEFVIWSVFGSQTPMEAPYEN